MLQKATSTINDSFELVSPNSIPRKLTKRQHIERKHDKKRKQLDAKIERERLRAEELAKNNRTFKPIYIRRVSHKPTYCTVNQILLNRDELPGSNNNAPPTFTLKNDVQSAKSLCRLKNAVNWMLLFADKKQVKTKIDKTQPFKIENIKTWSFRLAFITLTLSDLQQHSDEYIKEHLLQPFLYWLQRYYNCSYVWKAESQINGNIHFHITVDQFVPWKSVRAKWNKILAKHGYCKVFQDGTNDKGDSATQIKAVLHEAKCAKDIANYVAKKDKVPIVITKGFKAIWDGELTCTKDIRAAYKYLRYGKTDTDVNMFETVSQASQTSQLHCKFFSSLDPDIPKYWKPTGDLFKHVIDGRLWGCSSELSNIDIFIEEGDQYLKGEDLLNYEERIFFRQNPDIYNLGKTLIRRDKRNESNNNECERRVRCTTDEDIEHKYAIFKNVWIHPHLSLMKKGSHLQKLIHETKLTRKFNKQKFFTDN